MEASGQVQLFILIVLAGMAMGILFDFYRVVRGIFRLKLIMTSFLDLLYWLVAVFVVFGVLLAGNWGEVRLYVFIALLTGAYLYYRYFSRYSMHLMIHIIRKFIVALNYLRLVLLGIIKPFRYIAALIIKPLILIGKKIRQYFKSHQTKQ
jgi:spore cortex biosynthesis protein YabQ